MPARPQRPFCPRGCITQKGLPKRHSDATCPKLKATAANHQAAAASVPTAVSAPVAVAPAIATPAAAVETVEPAAVGANDSPMVIAPAAAVETVEPAAVGAPYSPLTKFLEQQSLEERFSNEIYQSRPRTSLSPEVSATPLHHRRAMSPIIFGTPSVLGSPKRRNIDPSLGMYLPGSITPGSLSTTSEVDTQQQFNKMNEALEALARKIDTADDIFLKESYLETQAELLSEKRQLMKGISNDDGELEGDREEEEEEEEEEVPQIRKDHPLKRAKRARTEDEIDADAMYIYDGRKREDCFRKGAERLKNNLETLGLKTRCHAVLYLVRGGTNGIAKNKKEEDEVPCKFSMEINDNPEFKMFVLKKMREIWEFDLEYRSVQQKTKFEQEQVNRRLQAESVQDKKRIAELEAQLAAAKGSSETVS